MVRFRKVNLYGNRYVIELMKHDLEDLGLSVGDFLNIEDAVKKKKRKSKNETKRN